MAGLTKWQGFFGRKRMKDKEKKIERGGEIKKKGGGEWIVSACE